MRKTKYRAWDMDAKTMHEVVMIQWPPMCPSGMEVYLKDLGWVVNNKENHQYELMEFVNLTDMHLNEVYAGDILSVSVKSGHTRKGEVKFFEEFGVWGLSPHITYGNIKEYSVPMGSTGSSTPYKPYTWKSFRQIEVIGNVWQHPHLLEGVKK